MSKWSKALLVFARKYPGKWHSYDSKRLTKLAVKELVELGLLEINHYQQFRLKERV